MLKKLFHIIKNKYSSKKNSEVPVRIKKEYKGFLYIFLDIDGVLNNLLDPEFDITNRVISHENLQAYKYLLAALDSHNIAYSIILSSAWRFNNEARYYLVQKGVLYHRSLSDLVDNKSKPRQKEIAEAIIQLGESNPNCLILDDVVHETDFTKGSTVVLSTDPKKGLTREQIDQTLKERLLPLWKI